MIRFLCGSVAHIGWAKRQRFNNQSLFALSLTHSRLRILAYSGIIQAVYFACRPKTCSSYRSQPLLVQRYKDFIDALSSRPDTVNKVQHAFLEEPLHPRRISFRTFCMTTCPSQPRRRLLCFVYGRRDKPDILGCSRKIGQFYLIWRRWSIRAHMELI